MVPFSTLLAVFMALFLFTPAWAQQPAWGEIRPEQLRQMLDQNVDLLLINTMSYIECRDHSIPGSICIPCGTFDEQTDRLRPYNLEKPLWVFVGSTVNAVYAEKKRKRSDVLTVARFLHRFLENSRGWAVKGIEKIIAGEAGLVDPHGEDVFEGKFEYLRDACHGPESVYHDILDRVFHTAGGGALHMCGIRGSDGELGLKVGGREDYFAVGKQVLGGGGVSQTVGDDQELVWRQKTFLWERVRRGNIRRLDAKANGQDGQGIASLRVIQVGGCFSGRRRG
jgi:hypothetical protein